MSDPQSQLVELMESKMADLSTSMDTFFVLIMGMVVLLMQCGFAFLEAGSVRSKNTSNILIKNLLDSFVGGITYWTVGYAFAYGDGNGFIGWHKFASDGVDDLELASWFFQFVFAATAATIVSGAVAERCDFIAYLVYSFFITGFIYPVVTHWVWHSDGWLAKGDSYTISGVNLDIGYRDFAGSGSVHVVGGVAAFCGALIIGPRTGRFHEDGASIPIRGHSVPLASLGGFILVFGFMAFNGGSELAISSPESAGVVSLAITNSVLSGSAAAFVSLLFHKIFGNRTWSLLNLLNGCLTGMVAICAGCNVVRPWGAVSIGAVAGLIYQLCSLLMVKIKVDDPLDAVAVHFGGGSWGVIAVAFFSWKGGIIDNADEASGYFLAWQLAGLASILAWTATLSSLMFLVLKLLGILRVSPELEHKGLDIVKHGEPAYPLESYGHGHQERILTILENGQLSHVNQGFENGEAGQKKLYETPELIRSSSSSKFNGNGTPTKIDPEPMYEYQPQPQAQPMPVHPAQVIYIP